MGLFNHFLDRITHSRSEQLVQQASNEHFVEHFDHYHHLMRLQDNRQLLEVFVSGHKNSFQSMIIGIDFIEGIFRIDEFSPFLSHPESLVNQTITIRHYHNWQKLEISATVTQWSSEDHCYSLLLPEFLDYQPRRHYPRLILDRQNVLKTHINPPYGSPWYATVKDISQGGMRINLPGDIRPHLHKDKALPKCQIKLGDNVYIQSRGVIRAFSYFSKPSRHTEISIEFCNMSHIDQTHLKQFLDYIEIAA